MKGQPVPHQNAAEPTQRIELPELATTGNRAHDEHHTAPPQPAQHAHAPAQTPTAALTIERGPNPGRRFSLTKARVTVVGRDPDCHIVLPHVTVSRRHAEIHPTTGYELIDLGSLNGTYINRRPLDSSPLTDGDELQLGIFRLTFHTTEEATT